MKICTYLLPIRRRSFSKWEAWDFAGYFRKLTAASCEVLVVDGSPESVFDGYDELWRDDVRHIRVDRRFGYLNDKVNGVHTGIAAASTEKIILADDDIRYTADDIDRMCALLDSYEVVRPQNYLGGTRRGESQTFEGVETQRGCAEACPSEGPASPLNYDIALGEHHPPSLPWWARMETARMLVNRATLRTADYPGTCAFRRETMLHAGHYDGDVLFDNEEIIRHFARAGARITYENDFFILKRAPTFRKWIEQRPRQAYEDFGLRTKTILFASIIPGAALMSFIGGSIGFCLSFIALLFIPVVIAWIGRRRGLAARHFDVRTLAYAPLWAIERSFSTYWAFYWYLRYGGYPFGDRLLSKGIGRDWLEGGKIASKLSASPSVEP